MGIQTSATYATDSPDPPKTSPAPASSPTPSGCRAFMPARGMTGRDGMAIYRIPTGCPEALKQPCWRNPLWRLLALAGTCYFIIVHARHEPHCRLCGRSNLRHICNGHPGSTQSLSCARILSPVKRLPRIHAGKCRIYAGPRHDWTRRDGYLPHSHWLPGGIKTSMLEKPTLTPAWLGRCLLFYDCPCPARSALHHLRFCSSSLHQLRHDRKL